MERLLMRLNGFQQAGNQGGWSPMHTSGNAITLPIAYADSGKYIPSVVADKDTAFSHSLIVHRNTDSLTVYIYPTNVSTTVHYIVIGVL